MGHKLRIDMYKFTFLFTGGAALVRPSTLKNLQRLSSQHYRQLKPPGVHNISMWTSPRVTYRCHQKIHVSNPFWIYIKQKLYEIWRSPSPPFHIRAAPSSPKKPTPFSTPRNSIQRKGASELRWLRKELQDLKGTAKLSLLCCIKFWKLYRWLITNEIRIIRIPRRGHITMNWIRMVDFLKERVLSKPTNLLRRCLRVAF